MAKVLTAIGAASGAIAGVVLLSKFEVGISKCLFINVIVNCFGLLIGNMANFFLYCKQQPIVLGRVVFFNFINV